MIKELCGSPYMGVNMKELSTELTSQVAEIPMNVSWFHHHRTFYEYEPATRKVYSYLNVII